MDLIEVHNELANTIEGLVDTATKLSAEIEAPEGADVDNLRDIYNSLTTNIDELVELLNNIEESVGTTDEANVVE